MIDFIDYSQYRAFTFCPMFWWEKYKAGVSRAWPEAQRDDPICVGSMVHSALENLYTIGEAKIDERVVEEVTPKPEAYALAQALVEGFKSAFPQEAWEEQRCEEALTFPLDDEVMKEGEGVKGLAKVDRYFRLDRQVQIPVGDGTALSLAPGWWISEYKTKAVEIDRALWTAAWTTSMQADFQCLALHAKLGEYPNGVLVTALEKPRTYVPERKCKGCGGRFELATWIPREEGMSACPFCGNLQKLKEYQPKVERKPSYFRCLAVREPDMLEWNRTQMARILERMKLMAVIGPDFEPWHRDNCVQAAMRRKCEYFEPHAKGLLAEAVDGFEKRDPLRYIESLQRVA